MKGLKINTPIKSKDLWQYLSQWLQEEAHYSLEEANSLSFTLLEASLALDKAAVLAQKEIRLSAPQEGFLRQAFIRLQSHEPWQYIVGEVDFLGLKLGIKPGVLIPRPETEELAQYILAQEKKRPSLKILDLGCGSACLSLALAYYLKGSEVWAWDISEEALNLAKKNSERLQTPLKLQKQDILQVPNLKELTWDIMLSNPPYVRESERALMQKNVRDYEPAGALFVPDEDPLIFYRAILEQSRKGLKPGGRLYLEINEALGSQTQALLESASFNAIQLKKDFRGRDRFLIATKAS